MHIVERRVPRNGPVIVRLANGTWIEEALFSELVEAVSEDASEEE